MLRKPHFTSIVKTSPTKISRNAIFQFKTIFAQQFIVAELHRIMMP